MACHRRGGLALLEPMEVDGAEAQDIERKARKGRRPFGGIATKLLAP